MLNGLWAFMMIAGIIYGSFNGNIQAVTEAAFQSAGEAVSLCITMLGIMSFWTGILKIGERAGVIEALTRKMTPLIHFLFPELPCGHPAVGSISANLIANVLGLGWAATPAGLKAMEDLKKLEEERRRADPMYARSVPEGTASGEMCTFLIMNISSLQLIPVNMIAYRSRYGSRMPMAIVGPALVITLVTTLVAVVFCRERQNLELKRREAQKWRWQNRGMQNRGMQNRGMPGQESWTDGNVGGGRL